MLLFVQHGGAIAILYGSTHAILRSCTLSSNEAKQVHRHAGQEHCRKHLCMLRSVLCLVVGACMYEECRSGG